MQDIETSRPHLSASRPSTTGLSGANYIPLKRVTDLLVTTVLLILFSPVFLLIAIAVKLSSPGPVLYRQQRIGYDGKPFEMLKFRTMTVSNANTIHREHVQRLIRENLRPEDLGVQSLKIVNDTRVTGIGKLLRATSLDELPQLFNVLWGEMSLVGPRPPLPYEYELYTDWHKQRLRGVPGITGLWQVTAHNRVSFDEMVQIDLDYIDRMNLGLDLYIMACTPIAMLRGE
jgi:lipopolysaccharide/colanic/teichoic acid biosynthesis glycosyltransferase